MKVTLLLKVRECNKNGILNIWTLRLTAGLANGDYSYSGEKNIARKFLLKYTLPHI